MEENKNLTSKVKSYFSVLILVLILVYIFGSLLWADFQIAKLYYTIKYLPYIVVFLVVSVSLGFIKELKVMKDKTNDEKFVLLFKLALFIVFIAIFSSEILSRLSMQ